VLCPVGFGNPLVLFLMFKLCVPDFVCCPSGSYLKPVLLYDFLVFSWYSLLNSLFACIQLRDRLSLRLFAAPANPRLAPVTCYPLLFITPSEGGDRCLLVLQD
jgi:hypothetical protein